MPELPDLLYIAEYLQRTVVDRRISEIRVRQPVVLRVAIPRPLEAALLHACIREVEIHGPFLRLAVDGGTDLIMHLMLMGRLQHQPPDDPPQPYLCLSLTLDDQSHLNLCDEQKRAKCYVVPRGSYGVIPLYDCQGVDIQSPAFTLDTFRSLVRQHSRKQVRSFLNNHTVLSSIGNAYADEILFEAQIHPKTFVARLSPGEVDRLFTSIHTVMDRGIAHVREAQQPIHVKVRDHMQVRMRKGEHCPRCGGVVRREGVRGFDVYFCPQCQRPSRKQFIDWRRV